MEIPNFKDVIASSPCVFTIGVVGDSGSGKTTFTNIIRHIFGDDLVSTITLDDYHLYDRHQRRVRNLTPLAPEANNLAGLERDIALLKNGKHVQKMRYNHDTGKIEGPFPFAPAKIVILEGLHTLFTQGLRDLIDFSVFVDPDEDVKFNWKRKRDTGERGYSTREVDDEIERRKADYLRYVAPQRRYADSVIRITTSEVGNLPGGNDYRITLLQVPLERRVEDTSITIDLFSILSLSDRNFTLSFSREILDGRKLGALAFDGELPADTVRILERSIENQTKVHPVRMCNHCTWVSSTEIARLILAWRIINRRIFIEDEWKGCPGMKGIR